MYLYAYIYTDILIYTHTPPFSLLKCLFTSQTSGYGEVYFPDQISIHRPIPTSSCFLYYMIDNFKSRRKKWLNFWRLSRGINSVTRKKARRWFGLHMRSWKTLQNTVFIWYSNTLTKRPYASYPLQMPDSGVSADSINSQSLEACHGIDTESLHVLNLSIYSICLNPSWRLLQDRCLHQQRSRELKKQGGRRCSICIKLLKRGEPRLGKD